MRVLLTGGAGFIGRHVMRELIARGHEVRAVDSLRADVHADPAWTPPPGVSFEKADVRDASALDRLLAGVEAVRDAHAACVANACRQLGELCVVIDVGVLARGAAAAAAADGDEGAA